MFSTSQPGHSVDADATGIAEPTRTPELPAEQIEITEVRDCWCKQFELETLLRKNVLVLCETREKVINSVVLDVVRTFCKRTTDVWNTKLKCNKLNVVLYNVVWTYLCLGRNIERSWWVNSWRGMNAARTQYNLSHPCQGAGLYYVSEDYIRFLPRWFYVNVVVPMPLLSPDCDHALPSFFNMFKNPPL